MKRKLFSLFSLLIGFLGFSQTEVYFKYDEAGNQRYRGTNINGKQAPEELTQKPTKTEETVLKETKTVAVVQKKPMDEKTFLKQIRLYPVPVNDVLTIDWTEEADELIETVSLYQHSTVHWKFQQQNIPSLNRQLKINMSGYQWGVYILHFTLKDGRVFTRNITKR
ncbi:T9SS type A sorting domain-containing protein [Chryseobacterium daecheongense]|uniref:T9SS type A sorting domain-containing protein n=1 Tax=Chryseobacterium daecheongense TaxID=192389 RepID=UPI001FD64EE6|nr:T9SS type A sorting domain-containing protein [Chryseobacterium daecheongense]UOU96846.1 T9SS type A sorting domain-containing protein [Chryseobacterium daecheongense]